MGFWSRPTCCLWTCLKLVAHTCACQCQLHTNRALEHICLAYLQSGRPAQGDTDSTTQHVGNVQPVQRDGCIVHLYHLLQLLSGQHGLATSSSRTHLGGSLELGSKRSRVKSRICQQRHQLRTIPQGHQPVSPSQLHARVQCCSIGSLLMPSHCLWGLLIAQM